MTADTPGRWRTVMTPLLVLHAVSVVALTVLFFSLSNLSGPDDGANIGAGMVLLPLGALGLPWSLLTVVERLVVDGAVPRGPLPEWANALDLVFLIAPAYVNVLLHVWGGATGRSFYPVPGRGRGGEEEDPRRFILVLGVTAAVLVGVYAVQQISA